MYIIYSGTVQWRRTTTAGDHKDHRRTHVAVVVAGAAGAASAGGVGAVAEPVALEPEPLTVARGHAHEQHLLVDAAQVQY